MAIAAAKPTRANKHLLSQAVREWELALRVWRTEADQPDIDDRHREDLVEG